MFFVSQVWYLWNKILYLWAIFYQYLFIELKNYHLSIQDVLERVDCRHLDICSVDPPGCTDIDDALHARLLPNGNYEVWRGHAGKQGGGSKFCTPPYNGYCGGRLAWNRGGEGGICFLTSNFMVFWGFHVWSLFRFIIIIILIINFKMT